MKQTLKPSSLLGATALATSVYTSAGLAQGIDDCVALVNGQVPPDCAPANADDLVQMPVGAQSEPETAPATNDAGFSISLDGVPLDSDPTVEDVIRKTDIQLERADVQVRFDGFDPETRLAVETVGAPRAYRAGDQVTLKSETNYPAFIRRAEFRLIDRDAVGGARLLGVVPVDPNGTATLTLPAGDNIVVVHRVYGPRGRYDETEPLPLGRPDDRGLLDTVEEGAETTAVRNIRVNGGAVTVYASDIAPGARLRTLGTTVTPDPNGKAVIQRILPPGAYDVDVAIDGPQGVAITRPIEVPGSEWYYVGVADLTWERVKEGDERETRTLGRLQYYVDGETQNGWQVTSSLDTGEEELSEIFKRLDEKDPRSVLDRIDPEDSYPTYGDDSEIRDDTPTSGKFYLRLERDGTYALWGDYKATVSGSTFLRNERSLYGLQGVYKSNSATEDGEPRVSAEIYAAEPDQLVGRESFRGTGGSVYFLRRQDITPGTETLSIEIRDADTGRVIDRQILVAGRDYQVNYLQGVITLSSPLTGSTNNNLIQTNTGGDQVVNLVAQYEFTPTSSDVDGFSYGGRLEVWATDQLRLGLTGTSDDTGGADQQALALDLRYQFGQNSFVQFDAARSDGPGYDTDFSIDGGLTIDGTPAEDGTGNAYRLAVQADLQDLGYNRDGALGAYYERRDQGFSTLDYQVTATTGDETLYGAFARVKPTEDALGWAIYADVYENDVGNDKTEIGAELEGRLAPRLSFRLGAEYLDETTATTDGSRLDVAGRLTFQARPGLSYALFGQTTASSDGLDDYHRLGVGVSAALNEAWTLNAEVSGGTGGLGAKVLANYQTEGRSAYFGYELDTGRALDAGVSRDKNGGKYIVGGKNQVNDSIAVFGENTYDIFGDRRTLTSAYGIEYTQSEFMTYTAALEIGQIDSDVGDNLDRTALSLGMRYEDDSLRTSTKLEFRRDKAAAGSSFNDFDAIYFDANARYKISESARLILDLSAADSDSDESAVLNGQLIDASFGYAFRPIDNERLNVLARYRFLKDTFGQEIDGADSNRARQESHIFSLEASYDLNRHWTLGGKIGGRISQTATGNEPWIDNDAYLAVVNARYNLVHNWDVLLEARSLNLVDADVSESSVLGAVYRHVGNNAKIGVGYNFGTFSDDLSDLSRDDEGLFVNLIAKF